MTGAHRLFLVGDVGATNARLAIATRANGAIEWVHESRQADADFATFDAAIDALVVKLVSRSPTAVRLGKQGAHAMRDMALGEALEYAQLMIAMMARTKDAKEGFAAFAEKRAPNWKNR